MKDVDNTPQDQVAEVRHVQQKKKMQFIGTMLRPSASHRLYEFNKQTLELRIVKPVQDKAIAFPEKKEKRPEGVYIKPHDPVRLKFPLKEGCFYLYALNEKNAVRKINKRFVVPCIKVITDIDEQPNG